MCKAMEDWKKEIEEETTARVTAKVEAETTARVTAKVEEETTVRVQKKIITGLLRKGLLSLKDAAAELGMSESEISLLMD